MVTQPKNEAEAQEMREAVAAFDRKQAQAVYDEQAARFAPLRELLDSDAYKEVREKVGTLSREFGDIDAVDVHLRNLPGFLDRLAGAVENATPRPPVALDNEEAAAPAAPPAE